MNKKLILIGSGSLAAIMTIILVSTYAATSHFLSLDSSRLDTSGPAVECSGYLEFDKSECGGSNVSSYKLNLTNIRGIPGTRTTYMDSSSYQSTPSSQLKQSNHTVSKPIPAAKNNDGKFRTKCGFSHLAYDDPIIAPNKPGQSHLHAFYGNTETNAYSTVDTIQNQGSSTCNGSELNRTAYWAPAMFDGKGNVRVANYITLYYKSGSDPTEYDKLTNYPEGLRKISGDAGASAPQSTGLVGWWCDTSRAPEPSKIKSSIPKCASNESLYGLVKFQRCWDGQNTWKADRSHLAYPNAGYRKAGVNTCNPPFKMLPLLDMFLHFEEHDGNTDQWYIASDVNKDGTIRGHGISLHSDWWNGWNRETNKIWNDRCNKEGRSTVSNLCNGTKLVDKVNGITHTSLSDFKTKSGAKTLIPGSDIIKLCPGATLPAKSSLLAFCNN